jgi:hypothetical protein
MWAKASVRSLVLALALVNVAVYACLLPLWEGFDEPFHYGYVQAISVEHQFPVLNRARISSEIRDSFHFVPLSGLLSQAMPGSASFEQWSKLSEADRKQRRADLDQLTPGSRLQPSPVLNYEAQQAPLAYLTLAPVDFLLRQLHIEWRILWLRLLGGSAAALAVFLGLTKFVELLGLSPGFALAALTCVFELQMLWASVAHVGNDLLAIPLTVWFLISLLVTATTPTDRNLLVLAAIFAAGLLTKAYFLAFVPVLLVLMVRVSVRRKASARVFLMSAIMIVLAAGPWYARNLFLYRSLSGTQQSVAGIGLAQALQAVTGTNWLLSAVNFARWSLWTGNWSFLSFSRTTLNLELALLIIGGLLYLARLHWVRSPQTWVLFACGCFLASLAYQTAVTWVDTKGLSTNPEPWYAQGLIVCAIVLCFSGLQSAGVPGKIMASALVTLFAWVAVTTYFARLLPYYGSAVRRGSVAGVWHWWRSDPAKRLSTVLLLPPVAVFTLLAIFMLLLVLTNLAVLRRIWAGSVFAGANAM